MQNYEQKNNLETKMLECHSDGLDISTPCIRQVYTVRTRCHSDKNVLYSERTQWNGRIDFLMTQNRNVSPKKELPA